MNFEGNPQCQRAVEELASNNDLSNAEIFEALKGKFPPQDIQIALGKLFIGKNKGKFNASSGKTRQAI